MGNNKSKQNNKNIIESLNVKIKDLLERKDALLRFMKSEEFRVNEYLRKIKEKDSKGEKVSSDEIQEHMFGFMQYQVYEKELISTFERLNALISFAKESGVEISYRKTEVEDLYNSDLASTIFELKDGEIQYADLETPNILRDKIKNDYNSEIESDFLSGLRKHQIPEENAIESTDDTQYTEEIESED